MRLIDAYSKGELDDLFSSEETDGVDLSEGVSITTNNYRYIRNYGVKK
jgi:hypothetical protein